MKKGYKEYRKATTEEIANGSEEMILVLEREIDIDPIYEEKLKYDQRKKDGSDAFLMLMSELRIYSKENNLPREVNRYIEDKLEFVKSQVIEGQWISAREKLDLVIVEGYLTQELYDRIQLKIDTYILENY